MPDRSPWLTKNQRVYVVDFAGPPSAPTRKPNRDKRRLWRRNCQKYAGFKVERRDGIRKPLGQNPAWRGDFRQEKEPGDYLSPCIWWWGGTLRQTYVTQRLTTAANSCVKVRNPAPTAFNPTSSA